MAPRIPAMVATDDPAAARAARNILNAGGRAADAAVALGFALGVTLPSSAGLGGGGACIVHAAHEQTEVLDFRARAASDGDAAVPALARGLFALHAKYGKLPWAQVIVPAENLARFGHAVSRTLAHDLIEDGAALASDREALDAFMSPRRQLLQAGETVMSTALAATLERLRVQGGGAFGSEQIYVPMWVPAAGVDRESIRIFELPGDIARSSTPNEEKGVGTTSFVVADSEGNAVACVLSMGRAFGLGRIAKGSGFLLAPARDPNTPAPVIGIAITRAANSLLFAVAGAGRRTAERIAALTPAGASSMLDRVFADDGVLQNARPPLTNMLACAAAENATSSVCEARNDPRGEGSTVVLAARDR